MKTSTLLAALAMLVVASVASGCHGDTVNPAPADNSSTFAIIRSRIVAKGCAISGCHAGSTPSAGMSLEDAAMYASLVNARPTNAAASADGLYRVLPGNPDSSYFYMKLAGLLRDAYGERMPLGSHPLDSGELRYIYEWIRAGAPSTGHVADTALLNDEEVHAFVPLPPPTQGIQLHLQPFTILPNQEREIFSFMRTPNTQQVYVNRFEVRMRDHSHHFVLYGYDDRNGAPPLETPRELGKEMANFGLRTFMIGSQAVEFSYQFPPGIAMALPAHQGVDLNSHYVNHHDEMLTGEAYVNLYTVPSAQRIAQSLFFGPQNFQLPPGKRTVVRDTVISPSDVDLLMLTSHTHRRGEHFRIYLHGGPDNGQLVYSNDDWQSPAVKSFDTPIRLRAGQGIRLEVTYYNESANTLRFGYTSEDEMCIAIGYIVPA
ncbi:MAG: hypothetical protein JWQ98_1674 [Chlorobi bacterium]|nr:hypothetical protein [Chlorobiota bacterium]